MDNCTKALSFDGFSKRNRQTVVKFGNKQLALVQSPPHQVPPLGGFGDFIGLYWARATIGYRTSASSNRLPTPPLTFASTYHLISAMGWPF